MWILELYGPHDHEYPSKMYVFTTEELARARAAHEEAGRYYTVLKPIECDPAIPER
jgi:hypothetical protein